MSQYSPRYGWFNNNQPVTQSHQKCFQEKQSMGAIRIQRMHSGNISYSLDKKYKSNCLYKRNGKIKISF